MIYLRRIFSEKWSLHIIFGLKFTVDTAFNMEIKPHRYTIPEV